MKPLKKEAWSSDATSACGADRMISPVAPQAGGTHTNSDTIIRVESVGKVWAKTKKLGQEVVALTPVSLQIKAGEFIVLLGPSGCGKSTLLRMIAGLDQPTSGGIFVSNREVAGPSCERGMMFQDYALFPWRSVFKNITFGLEACHVDRAEQNRIAAELIDLVGLTGFEESYPGQLSGGMQQRVSLARALANDPEVLLMDEPFSAVDAQTRETLQDELLRIWRLKGKTIVFVTHDISEAVYLADRVITMSARPGRIRSDMVMGLPRPRDRESNDFLGMARRLRQELKPDSDISARE
ncbi:ABC transporter ATP-binding protein [Pusillimonas sp.]|uniref:ABC transporter ATP-binding protein n=1 Tax=Pusillimonas sp. TaxID=3040095 RepID=UPI0037C7CB75